MNHVNVLSTQKYIKNQFVVKMTFRSLKIKTTVLIRSHFETDHDSSSSSNKTHVHIKKTKHTYLN